MTITRVQGNQANSPNSTSTTQAVTLGSGIIQGNFVVAAVACGNNATTITGPSGWTQAIINQPAGASALIETSIWYMVVPAGHAGETSWTWTFGAAHSLFVCIEEWSSTTGWNASPTDQTVQGDTAGTPTASTTPASGTTSATSQASELWIASIAYKGSAQTETSITSGWTKDLESTLASANTMTMLYQIASSTGTAGCQYTIGSGQFWAGVAATFKPIVVVTSSRTIPTTAALQSTLSRTIPATAALTGTVSRTIPATAALQSTNTRTVPATAALATTKSRTIPATAALDQPSSRTIPATAALTGTVSRTIPASAALLHTSSRTVPATAALLATSSRIVPVTAALATSSILSGGFALFANCSTGTVSYDKHFRVTQFPDPALSLANVTPRLGNSIVSWDGTIPASTTVKTSLDGVNWTDVSSSNGGSIPGLAGQPDPISDTFNSNTLANYTNTNKSGGSVATPTYDTGNSRISLVGGSGGLYLYTAITDNDVDLQAIMDESDAGGLVWRYVDSNNYYELGAYDDSASGGFTNALRLYKVVAGVRSLIGTASTIAWPRATTGTSPYKIVRVTMLGSTITVYFDGIVMQTATDTTFTSGKMGLRNDGGTSRYYLLRLQQIGDYVTGTPPGDVVTGDFVYTQVTMSTTDPTVTPQLQDLTTSARSPQIATGALIPQLHDPSKPFAVPFNTEMDTLTAASGDFWWDIDQNSSLTFAARNAQPAPWALHSSDLLFTPNVQPANGADLYRNRQNITNCLDTITVPNEQKIADGTATSWQMAYPLHSAPTIIVQGVTKTVGVQGVDTGKDFYWQAGSNGISQDSSAVKIPDGYLLQFAYIGQFTKTVTEDNLPEQAARQAVEGGTGIIEATEDGKGMLAANAIVYAQGLLAKHGTNNAVELIASTQRSELATGQLLSVFLPEHSINNAQLLIIKLTTTGQQQLDGSVLYEYQIDATNGPNLSNWSNVFFG